MAVFQIGQQAIKPSPIGEVARGLQAYRAGQQQIEQQKQSQMLNQLKMQMLRAQIGLTGAQAQATGVPKPQTPSQGINQLQLDFLNRIKDPDARDKILEQMITKPSSSTTVNVTPADNARSASEQYERLKTLSSTADKFNASGINPNAIAVVKTDAKGNNVLALEQKESPGAGERTDMAEAAASVDALTNLKTLFDDLDTFTGPIVGRTTPILGLIGQTKQKQEDLLAATFAFKNRIIKEITGAQMSEQEADRIMKQVPDITDPSKRWISKWEQTVKNLEFIQERRRKVLDAAGIRPTSAGETKKYPEQPGVFKLGEVRKNSSGKEYKYIGEGKWQAVK